MARVICTLPNTAQDLDGLAWAQDRGQLISPDLPPDRVARYLTIPGFILAAPLSTGSAPPDQPNTPAPLPIPDGYATLPWPDLRALAAAVAPPDVRPQSKADCLAVIEAELARRSAAPTPAPATEPAGNAGAAQQE